MNLVLEGLPVAFYPTAWMRAPSLLRCMPRPVSWKLCLSLCCLDLCSYLFVLPAHKCVPCACT